MNRLHIGKLVQTVSLTLPMVLASACSTPYKSVSVTAGANTGMLYSLPKAQVRITASRHEVSDEDVATIDKELTKIKTEKDLVENSLGDARKLELNAKAILAKAGNSVKVKAKDDYELAQALTKGLESLKKNFGERISDIEANRKVVIANQGKWVESIKIEPLAVVADESRRFLLDLDHSVLRNDGIDISVENGLLSSSKAVSDDQSKSIVLNLVQGFSAFKAPRPNTYSMALNVLETDKSFKPNDNRKSGCEKYSYVNVFDPTNLSEFEQVKKDLSDNSASVDLVISKAPKKRSSEVKNQNVDGIVYRAPLNLKITASSAASATSACAVDLLNYQDTTTMIVPDPDAEFVLIPRAGAFTKSQFDIVFKDGSPIKYNVDRPSELAGIASLPVEIAKALISIPTEIVRLRVDYDSKANSAIEVQTAALKAQLDLLKMKAALEAEKEDNKP